MRVDIDLTLELSARLSLAYLFLPILRFDFIPTLVPLDFFHFFMGLVRAFDFLSIFYSFVLNAQRKTQ